MIKQTLTYLDFNGESRTEDFYFNLTKAELTEMELGTEGGLIAMMERIIAANSKPEIVAVFKNMVLKAYGEKSPEGRYFRKSDQIREDFASTQAYSDLFMKLASDSTFSAEFVNGIVPEMTEEEKAAAEKEISSK